MCLVARQAESILQKEDNAALQAALSLLQYLENDYSSITAHEGDHPFTECATFADDIKGMGYSFQSNWHFINIPYFDQGGDSSDFPNFHEPAQDVVGALTDLVGFLKGDTPITGSYYLDQIAKHFTKLEDQQSFALRLVIHYIGDIHQPLHAVALVDSKYPSGDEGGNAEKIPSYEGVSDLHFVWDSVVYEFTGRESLVSPPPQCYNIDAYLSAIYLAPV